MKLCVCVCVCERCERRGGGETEREGERWRTRLVSGYITWGFKMVTIESDSGEHNGDVAQYESVTMIA